MLLCGVANDLLAHGELSCRTPELVDVLQEDWQAEPGYKACIAVLKPDYSRAFTLLNNSFGHQHV